MPLLSPKNRKLSLPKMDNRRSEKHCLVLSAAISAATFRWMLNLTVTIWWKLPFVWKEMDTRGKYHHAFYIRTEGVNMKITTIEPSLVNLIYVFKYLNPVLDFKQFMIRILGSV